MPTVNKAVDLDTAVLAGGEFGNGAIYSSPDGGVKAATSALGDIFRLCKIPAGARVNLAALAMDDLDSNGTPTIAGKLGLSYADGSAAPAGWDSLFGSGITLGKTGGNAAYACHPVTLTKDAYLDFVVTTAAATHQDGQVSGHVMGSYPGFA